MKKVMILLFTILAIIFGISQYNTHKYMAKFQSGELHLECHFRSGTKDVIPDGIIETSTGVVYYGTINGHQWSARNCDVYKPGE